MATQPIVFPFDPTGTASTNKVTGERKPLTPTNGSNLNFLVPDCAPFFRDGFRAIHFPSGRELEEGKDFLFTHRFHDATLSVGKPIFGSISFFDKQLAGVIALDYQTLGGEWTIDQTKIAEVLANSLYNPRVTTWEQVVELPYAFPPIDHEHNTKDMVGMSEVVNKIGVLAETIAEAGGQGLQNHIDDKNNPHQVTKVQLGLGNVQDFGIASVAEAIEGVRTNKYMTPALVRQAVDSVALNPLRSHVESRDNPHQVTKAQVGLGNVQDYPMATLAQAQSGDNSRSLMSASLTRSAIEALALGPFQAHVADKNNPHQTTKEQLGLGQVANYAPADVASARLGTADNMYMTPVTVREAINAQVFDAVSSHVNNKNNPHQVTKAQVGLGNVPNYTVATTAEAIGGAANDRFMTPARTAEYFNATLGGQIQTHIDDRSNPHGTTKSQVGLGLVENYPIASNAEAIAGTLGNRYMTPANTKAMIDASVGPLASQHLTDLTNPHRTTKEQIGLGNVDNFSTATNEQAVEGISSSLFVTPASAAALVDAKLGGYQSNPQFTTHLSDQSNPHGTTKEQVGLGLVDNFGTATLQQATDPALNNLFVTPAGVAAAVAAATTDEQGNSLVEHVRSTNNPHRVTKAQVGLSQVQDYPIADEPTAVAGTSVEHYIVPATLVAAIRALTFSPDGTSPIEHATLADNPHRTTKDQIGLGNVDNFLTATVDQARGGVSMDTFVTPAGVAAAIEQRMTGEGSIAQFSAHLNDLDNPHVVTKTQVGLGLVENYPPATLQEAQDGVASDRFVTPAGVKAFFDTQDMNDQVRTDMIAFMANRENPTGVTATQIGLSNVLNFGIATTDQAIEGNAGDVYMTPSTTLAAINAHASQATVPQEISDHLNRIDNPHQVTAEQIGTMTTQDIQLALSEKLGAQEMAVNAALLEGQSLNTILGQARQGIGLTANEWNAVVNWSYDQADPATEDNDKLVGLLTITSSMLKTGGTGSYLVEVLKNGRVELTPLLDVTPPCDVFVATSQVDAGSTLVVKRLWINAYGNQAVLTPLIDPANRFDRISSRATRVAPPEVLSIDNAHYRIRNVPNGAGDVGFGLEAGGGINASLTSGHVVEHVVFVNPENFNDQITGQALPFMTDNWLASYGTPAGSMNWGQWTEENQGELSTDLTSLRSEVGDYPALLIGDGLHASVVMEADVWAEEGIGLMGIALLHPKGNGWTGLYAMRGLGNQNGLEHLPDHERIRPLVVGSDLFQSGSNIVWSASGALAWGDGTVDADRDGAVFNADNHQWSLEKKTRIRMVLDGESLTVSTSQLGSQAYEESASYTLNLSQTPFAGLSLIPALVSVGLNAPKFEIINAPCTRYPVVNAVTGAAFVWNGGFWSEQARYLKAGRLYYDTAAKNLYTVRRNGRIAHLPITAAL